MTTKQNRDYWSWDIQDLRDECGKRELRYPSQAPVKTLSDILEEDDINEEMYPESEDKKDG